MEIKTLDLDYRGTPRSIASFLILGDSPVLVETGPASTLEVLDRRLAEHGISPAEVKHVLVTHIHLDHAGAAGHWAGRGARVFVHPKGAPHLVDPSKLLRSATRIYRDKMDEFWGDTVPAPADRVIAVGHGEPISIAGLEFRVIETGGHAWHHHAYRLGDVAFTGDAAGIGVPGFSMLELPAPPPEFDLEAWKLTLSRLRAEKLSVMYRTHFGPSDRVGAELDELEMLLDECVLFVEEARREGLERDAIVDRYRSWIRQRAEAAGADDSMLRTLSVANPREMSVDGILRYLERRD